MNPISALVSNIRLGAPLHCQGLTMFPCLAPEPRPPFYLTLDRALASGRFSIRELDEGGRVPTLTILNQLDQPVLIVDGEQLVGCKQNRVVNLTILVPAQAKLAIPVSCVEAGRWASSTPDFAASPAVFFAGARAAKRRSVSESLELCGRPMADQGEVWDCVAAKLHGLGVRSATSDINAAVERRRRELDDFVRALRPIPGQCGALFALGARIRGLDVFDSPETLAALAPKLAHSYALDAIDPECGAGAAPHEAPGEDDARAFLDELSRAELRAHPAVGLGQDLCLHAPGLAGGALELDGDIVHLCAFRMNDDNGRGKREWSPMARFSRRRERFD